MLSAVRRRVLDDREELFDLYRNLPNDTFSVVDLCWRLSNLQVSSIESFVLRDSFLQKNYYNILCEKVRRLIPHLTFNDAQIILSFLSTFNLPVNVDINGARCNIAVDLIDHIVKGMYDSFYKRIEAIEPLPQPVSLMSVTLLFCAAFKLKVEIDGNNYLTTETILKSTTSSLFGYISCLELLYKVPMNCRNEDHEELKLIAINGVNTKFDTRLMQKDDGDCRYWRDKLSSVVRKVQKEQGMLGFKSEVVKYADQVRILR